LYEVDQEQVRQAAHQHRSDKSRVVPVADIDDFYADNLLSEALTMNTQVVSVVKKKPEYKQAQQRHGEELEAGGRLDASTLCVERCEDNQREAWGYSEGYANEIEQGRDQARTQSRPGSAGRDLISGLVMIGWHKTIPGCA
jgi:hypothetical protein